MKREDNPRHKNQATLVIKLYGHLTATYYSKRIMVVVESMHSTDIRRPRRHVAQYIMATDT